MHVVVITNDPVRLSFLVALLQDAGIDAVVLDAYVSAMEGSIGAIPRRLAVPRRMPRRRCASCARPASLRVEAADRRHAAGRPGGYRQPTRGYRTGIEPVLLAASVAAQPGERVLEGGTGAGAGLLCLLGPAARRAGHRDRAGPGCRPLARDNIAPNGFDLARARRRTCWTAAGPRFDHAMANPPWHDAAGTARPTRCGMLPSGPRPACSRPGQRAGAGLRPGGSLTFVLPASSGNGAGGARQRPAAARRRCCRSGPGPARRHGCC